MKYLVKYTILIAMMPFVLLLSLIAILWKFELNPVVYTAEETRLKDALKEYFK